MRGACCPLLLIFLMCGCGSGANLSKSQESVKLSLDKWKAGETPQQLKALGIDMADPDWSAGYRLLDFQMKDVSAQPQQGPRVVVQLNMQSRAGKKADREVAYEVIFKDSDKISIGRDAFHVSH